MKRLVTISMLVMISLIAFGVALSACAQRGGARGRVSGHGASGGRGGFAASTPRGSSGSRSLAPARSQVPAQGLQRGSSGYPGSNASARASYSYQHRRPYRSPYGSRVFYGISGYGVPGPYVLEYPDGYDYDAADAAPDNGFQGYDAQPPYPEQPGGTPGIYPPAPVRQQTTSGFANFGLTNEDGVTLVFKDGRAPVQIHDYVLTRNVVYVWDRHQRVIPIDQLDMVATAKANSDAGVDFELPVATR